MRLKVTKKRVKVTERPIQSKSRRIKEEFNLKGNLQNFKEILDLHT